MPGDWKAYRDWKELIENTRKPRQEDDGYDIVDDDDDVQALVEMLKDYSE